MGSDTRREALPVKLLLLVLTVSVVIFLACFFSFAGAVAQSCFRGNDRYWWRACDGGLRPPCGTQEHPLQASMAGICSELTVIHDLQAKIPIDDIS
jgi:hypothetical protein